MIAYPATISGANPYPSKRDPHGGSSRQGRVQRGLKAMPRTGTFARAG